MQASPQREKAQQQAVAVFLPTLPQTSPLIGALTEHLLSSATPAAVITPESLKRQLNSLRETEGPQNSGLLEPPEGTAAGSLHHRKRQHWTPLQEAELLHRVSELQSACPTVCVLATRLPVASLFEQLAPRRRLEPPLAGEEGLLYPPDPPPTPGTAPSRLILVPLFRYDDEDGEGLGLAWGGEGSADCLNTPLDTAERPATAAVECARKAAAASAADAGFSCVSGLWGQAALQVGALRALEPTARILVVFVGTRTALTAPQPPPPEEEEAEHSAEALRILGADAAEAAPSATCRENAKLSAAAAPDTADAGAGGKGCGRKKVTSRRMKKRAHSRDLLSELDVLVCELLLLWQIDTAYEPTEEAAAALVGRLLKSAAASKQLRLLPKGKLRRLVASAREEPPAAACTAAAGGTDVVECAAESVPPDFPKMGTKADTVKRLWQAQLLQLPGVSEEVACAVSAAFPVPALLFERAAAEAAATKEAPSDSSRRKRRTHTDSGAPTLLQAELAAITVPGRCGERRVGDALARRILKVFALETDPEAPV
ncbi:uncharacterized protein LOC34622179 [Cyclospora cayetanensis]|uniref:Uncharacterized protein n=2 Tax=Cyclospora cayetanensis TaxID=88456 RepID=A0A1D3D7F8_9EIME|nr:uncharacterized protein LOC34622179 [Cyclospora cayetanensis]OEH79374.1 hypothetical protein cyc_05894 [Cyclospora cayetanensis]